MLAAPALARELFEEVKRRLFRQIQIFDYFGHFFRPIP